MTHTFKTSLFLLCVLGASVSFAGCGDDDDSTPTTTVGAGGENSAGGSSNGGKAGNSSAAGSNHSAGQNQGGTGQAGDASGGVTSEGGGAAGGVSGVGGDIGMASAGMAGAGGASAELACTQVAYGAAVFAHYVTTAKPAAAGGSITPGTYQLTKLTHYASASESTSNDPIHSAAKVTATTFEWASQAKDEPETRAAYTYVVSATNLNLVATCPEPGPADPVPFTANGDTLVVYLDAEYTFTRQQ